MTSATTSRTPSLTPSRSPTPEQPVQPDHFYGSDTPLPPSPATDGRPWLVPEDDPLAQRGIPVFKPTMDEFRNFEAYMNKIECWGMRSGIVKVIPPKEWTDALPSVKPQLADVKLRNPIEQEMMGHGGLFRQQNIEKRKVMSVREWAELCAREELRAPGVKDIGLHARATNGTVKAKTRRSRRKTAEPETAEPEIQMTPDVMVKEEEEDGEHLGISVSRVIDEEVVDKSLVSPPDSVAAETTPITPGEPGPPSDADVNERPSVAPSVLESVVHASRPTTPDVASTTGCKEEGNDSNVPKRKGRRNPQTREAREAALAERAEKDKAFLEQFDPHKDWLPPNTSNSDYTPEFCKELERRYWRNCGLGKPAWYGADMAGSLFTDDTQHWNVAHLESALSRLLPASNKGLPGVNTPYLYFGMWRATFAWHVEDMDLFSINYIHFGAPKFWYAVPQARAGALEQTMRGYFPKDTSQCHQFLRHKSYLASPRLLSQASCRPNFLVQREGEFVITYPRGYHAGFNLGFNCAESVNFALESWLALGRVAKACECVDFSVRIDVDQLLRDREAERHASGTEVNLEADASPDEELEPANSEQDIVSNPDKPKSSRKRKSDASADNAPKPKRIRTKASKPGSAVTASPSKQPKVTLKLGPKPQESDIFPCCLCASSSKDGLLRVHSPPVWQKEGQSGEGSSSTDQWQAHEECANVIPETWVDEIDVSTSLPGESGYKERMVFGTDAIPRDRWNLKCSACSKTRHKSHGAPIQCTKGKCPKAYHVSCARGGADSGISYRVLQEVENDVLLSDPNQMAPAGDSSTTEVEDTRRVLSLVKKLEVEVLCPQHNPVMLEAKKAAKQDKIRNMLVALPPMTRIKLRVSAGVFEVSLVRVVEETGCVEVLWDRGHKREFKWSSVVFGNSDQVVGQKPTEMAPDPPRSSAATPSPTATATASQPTSFYLPLGSSGNVEVRAPVSQVGQVGQYSYQASAASAATPSSTTYGQPYNSVYYNTYNSTSYQSQNSYGSGAWSYQHASQSQSRPSYPIGQSQNSVPYSMGSSSSQYPTGHTPYNGQSYTQNYYPHSSTSYTRPQPQSTGYAEDSVQQHPSTHPASSAPHGYSPAHGTQYSGSYAPYDRSGSHSQRPSYASTPSYDSHQQLGYGSSHSQTPLHVPELRWQQPYQGPKVPAARASEPTSRASSVHLQSGHASRAHSAFPTIPPQQHPVSETYNVHVASPPSLSTPP